VTLSYLTGAALTLAITASAFAQPVVPEPMPVAAGHVPYLVFFRGRAIGREELRIVRDAQGWLVTGTSRQGPPIDVTTRKAEVRYDGDWHPLSMVIDAVLRGQDVLLNTTFADGKATSVISTQGQPESKTDAVSADAVVLPNQFLGAYAVLGLRLQGKPAGTVLRAYIPTQIEVPATLGAVAQERIDTPKASIPVTHYTVQVTVGGVTGTLELNLWFDGEGGLIRMSVPSQTLEIAREDIATATSRTAAFSVKGDEPVMIPATGFNLAATFTRPASAPSRLPAIVLIGGSGPTDRDETVAGIPVFGHLARDLAAAGFAVVRYDKRGVGQSGGRLETVTIADYAEDARAVVKWLEKRKDIDKGRIAVVGHSEGALVAMLVSDLEDDLVSATVLVAGPSTRGREIVLEQQTRLLDLMKVPAADREQKVALEVKILDAVEKGARGDWTGVPEAMRRAADTPWFHSFITLDPADAMKDLRQPVLIVQGELDTQVPPYHADKLAEMARARKKKADVQVLKVPGVNHLLVPAKTGEVNEYSSLTGAEVSPVLTSGIGVWLAKTLK
jgi:pimeloyl-ACP methyl ester carboxylesterase